MASFLASLYPMRWANDGRDEIARGIIDRIVDSHSVLAKLPDLRPGEVINEVLTNLVALCCQIHDVGTIDKVLKSSRVSKTLPSLRSICSEAESCLEYHWAAYIAAGRYAGEAAARLEQFPYYRNYEELARLELGALCSIEPAPPAKIAFLGSGPLPLTSLCLLRALRGGLGSADGGLRRAAPSETAAGPVVLNVDHDSAACATASALTEKLGDRAQGMEFACADAGSSVQDLATFDVVFVAALVGKDQAEKQELIVNVAARMRKGAFMVVRSSWGLRTCLYPEVDLATEKLLAVLQIMAVVHPYGNVVNSVIVAKVTSGSTIVR